MDIFTLILLYYALVMFISSFICRIYNLSDEQVVVLSLIWPITLLFIPIILGDKLAKYVKK